MAASISAKAKSSDQRSGPPARHQRAEAAHAEWGSGRRRGSVGPCSGGSGASEPADAFGGASRIGRARYGVGAWFATIKGPILLDPVPNPPMGTRPVRKRGAPRC